MKKILLLATAAFSLTASESAAQTWIKTGAPDTVSYSRILTLGNDSVFAIATGTAGKYLVSSIDGGASWEIHSMSSRYGTPLLSPYGIHMNYYYNLGSPWQRYIAYSNDRGATWSIMAGSDLGGGSGYTAMALMGNGNLLLGHTSGYLNLTSDPASTGTDHGSVFEFENDYYYYARNPNTGRIIMGHDDGSNQMAYTDDNGMTLSEISIVSLIGNVYAPIVRYSSGNTFYNGRMGGIVKSTDDGNTWAGLTGTVPTAAVYMLDFNVNQLNQIVRVHQADAKVFFSSDGGNFFSALNTGLDPASSPTSVGATADNAFWIGMYNSDPATGGIYKLTPPVSVRENGSTTMLSTYPNPASGHITIDGSDKQMEFTLFNIEMQRVATVKAENGRIDVSMLQPGIYFLKGTGTNQNLVGKFVVAR